MKFGGLGFLFGCDVVMETYRGATISFKWQRGQVVDHGTMAVGHKILNLGIWSLYNYTKFEGLLILSATILTNKTLVL